MAKSSEAEQRDIPCFFFLAKKGITNSIWTLIQNPRKPNDMKKMKRKSAYMNFSYTFTSFLVGKLRGLTFDHNLWITKNYHQNRAIISNDCLTTAPDKKIHIKYYIYTKAYSTTHLDSPFISISFHILNHFDFHNKFSVLSIQLIIFITILHSFIFIPFIETGFFPPKMSFFIARAHAIDDSRHSDKNQREIHTLRKVL